MLYAGCERIALIDRFCVHFCVSEKGVYTRLIDTKLRQAPGKRRDKIALVSDSHGLNVRLSLTGGVMVTAGEISPYHSA